MKRLTIALIAAVLLLAQAASSATWTRVTVAATSTLIYTVPDGQARKVLIRNPSAVSVYVGATGVTTTTGFEIATLDAASFVLVAGDSIYGVVAASTQVVHTAASQY